MTAFATAGAGFLIAVLWFDLMFDVQTRKHDGAVLPPEVLKSISTYYRRVTTDAHPMGRLIAVVMFLTLLFLIAEIATAIQPLWIGSASFVIAAAAVGITGARTVRNAVRLGGAEDPPEAQSVLARTIYRDHVFCFAAMSTVLVLQLTGEVLR